MEEAKRTILTLLLVTCYLLQKLLKYALFAFWKRNEFQGWLFTGADNAADRREDGFAQAEAAFV